MRGVLETGVAEVHGRVQGDFEPLLQSWKTMTDAHQAEMRSLYARVGEQAAEQYRERLENVSKQWMLATVASLDQQSRQVLSGVSATAESKMRDTFTKVFADMGETLRERLRQIAANVEFPSGR
jgi:excinuclease UvrABC ATPase subunit